MVAATEGAEIAVDSQLHVLKADVDAELENARASFHDLLDAMSPNLRRQPSNGTKWSNEELLFHMMFGYMILWSLIWLVKFFGRMPMKVSVIFGDSLAQFPYWPVQHRQLPGLAIRRASLSL